jgi:general secretion pathway protein I
MNRASERRRAFTLIEVLISLAILALAAIVLGAAYANTLDAHRAIAARAVVGAPVEYLREQLLNEPEREKIEKGGEVQLPENRRLRWEAKVEEAAVPDLFKVVVTGRVDGGTTGRPPEEFTRTLMLLRPTWSDPQRREQLRSDWRARYAEEAKR